MHTVRAAEGLETEACEVYFIGSGAMPRKARGWLDYLYKLLRKFETAQKSQHEAPKESAQAR